MLFRSRQAILKKALTEAEAAGLAAARRILRALDVQAAFYEADAEPNRRLVREWLRAGGPLLAEASNGGALLAAVIEDGRAKGEIRADVNEADAGALIGDAFFGALYRWAASSEREVSLRQSVKRTVTLVLRAIVA